MNQTMISAAEWAGLPATTDLVHEPEAAAAYCLLESQFWGDRSENSFKNHAAVKDSVLVLDAGCGTVDLVTYLIESRSPHLRMRESITGTAGIHGSGQLNRYFYEFLNNQFKEELTTVLINQQKRVTSDNKALVLKPALRVFEEQKKDFGSADEMPLRFHIPGLTKKLKTSRRYVLPGASLSLLFRANQGAWLFGPMAPSAIDTRVSINSADQC